MARIVDDLKSRADGTVERGTGGYKLCVTIAHTFARSFIAPAFIAGGLEGFRKPAENAKNIGPLATRMAGRVGFRTDPVFLARVNGGVQVAAGALLAIGWVPRLSSAALAVSLVPTTIAGHRYWLEPEPEKRKQQRTELLTNLAMLGGLIFAATDTNGAPSIRWRAARAAGMARSRASHAMTDASHTISGRTSAVESFGARALAAASLGGGRMLRSAGHVANSGSDWTSHAADVGADRAAQFAGRAATAVSHLGAAVGEKVTQAAEAVTERVAHAAEAVTDKASDLARGH